MCKSGLIAYIVNELSGITGDWIIEHVVANMRLKGYDRQVCLVWGHAVLFPIFDASGKTAVPLPILEHVTRASNDLGMRYGIEEHTHPIKRMSLAITGSDSDVIMGIIGDDMQGSEGVNSHQD
jgi:hypothetical protein